MNTFLITSIKNNNLAHSILLYKKHYQIWTNRRKKQTLFKWKILTYARLWRELFSIRCLTSCEISKRWSETFKLDLPVSCEIIVISKQAMHAKEIKKLHSSYTVKVILKYLVLILNPQSFWCTTSDTIQSCWMSLKDI